MKHTRASASAGLRRASLREGADDAWNERAGRLFAEFERPARNMVRRAFRGAFSADEIEDIYASAWVGTLRALAGRQAGMTDAEVRSYVLTAVANQAGKELRRRRRKPTSPLELVGRVADDGETPDERATGEEQSRITRDLLASLPPRRRAVILLRYGWGLEPKQVCALVEGLSPRAYRKEITRGVEELTERMRAHERGEWCADREPLLRALVSGLADSDQQLQARAHLAHCRDCADFVARLSGHLHDLGGAAAAAGAIDGIDGHLTYADRAIEVGERVRDAAAGLVARAPTGAEEGLAQATAAGGARGAGAAGAGVLAKLAGLGSAGKLAVACLGGGVAATACVAAGVAPFGLGGDREQDAQKQVVAKPRSELRAEPGSTEPAPDQLGNETLTPEPAPSPEAVAPKPSGAEPDVEPAPQPEVPLAPSTPPVQREFGVAAATPAASPPVAAPEPSTSSAGSDGGGSAVQQEFGP